MKTLLIKFISIIIILGSTQWNYSQDLKNTSWIKIKAERKDSSKIVDLLGTETSDLKYTFKKGSEALITSAYEIKKTNWSFINRLLSIGQLQQFDVELLNDTFLTITEKRYDNPGDDKINRFYFIKENYYERYLMKLGLIQMQNDTTVFCNRYLYPYFSGGYMDDYLMKRLTFKTQNAYVIGSILIHSDRSIGILKIDTVVNLNEKQLGQVKNVILSTDKKWDLPLFSKPIGYYLNFTIGLVNTGEMKTIMFTYNSQEKPCFEHCTPVSPEDMRVAAQNYDHGLQLILAGKERESITNFTQSITHNPYLLDAYYNRAYAYTKIQMNDKACEDWHYLKNLGQKEGEKLYWQHCKTAQ